MRSKLRKGQRKPLPSQRLEDIFWEISEGIEDAQPDIDKYHRRQLQNFEDECEVGIHAIIDDMYQDRRRLTEVIGPFQKKYRRYLNWKASDCLLTPDIMNTIGEFLEDKSLYTFSVATWSDRYWPLLLARVKKLVDPRCYKHIMTLPMSEASVTYNNASRLLYLWSHRSDAPVFPRNYRELLGETICISIDFFPGIEPIWHLITQGLAYGRDDTNAGIKWFEESYNELLKWTETDDYLAHDKYYCQDICCNEPRDMYDRVRLHLLE
jgi:hypothetical protein